MYDLQYILIQHKQYDHTSSCQGEIQLRQNQTDLQTWISAINFYEKLFPHTQPNAGEK